MLPGKTSRARLCCGMSDDPPAGGAGQPNCAVTTQRDSHHRHTAHYLHYLHCTVYTLYLLWSRSVNTDRNLFSDTPKSRCSLKVWWIKKSRCSHFERSMNKKIQCAWHLIALLWTVNNKIDRFDPRPYWCAVPWPSCIYNSKMGSVVYPLPIPGCNNTTCSAAKCSFVNNS